jgi:hypothetical protein
MAEMSEIMSSYQDMSVSELGSSLLQRKEERDKAFRKDARKQQNIEKALGLLLAGQAVFKGAYKKREKELDNALAFELENNKYQAKQIEEISQIVQYLPTDFGDAQTTDEKVSQFVASPQFESFKNALKPYADDRMKRGYAKPQDWIDFSNTTGYDNTLASVAQEYAREYIEGDKYKTFEGELRRLLGTGDIDRVELFKQGIGITEEKLNQAERRNYELILDEYRKKGNLMGGVKEVLTRIGLRDKEKTNARAVELGLSPDYDFNPFGKIDSNTLLGPNMSSILDSMNLKGSLNQIIDRSQLISAQPEVVWKELAGLESKRNYRENILNIYLPSLQNQLEVGNKPIEGKQFNFVNKNTFEDVIKDLTSNESQKNLFITDVAAIGLRLQQDKAFIKGVYAQTDKTMSLDNFTKKIRENEEFRSHTATMLVLSEGVKNKTLLEDYVYTSTGTPEIIYDRSNSAIVQLVGEGIMPPKKDGGNYTYGEGYANANDRVKVEVYDAMVNKILIENSNNPNKLDLELTKFFNDVQNPLNLTLEDYLERLAQLKNEERRKREEKEKTQEFATRAFLRSRSEI